MKSNQKNTQFIVLLFVALAIFLGVFLVTSKNLNFIQRAGNPYQSYTKIQGDGDLDRAMTTLDNTDLNSIDREVQKNDQDASSF